MKLHIFSTVLASLFAIQAQAGVLFSDRFNHPDGPLVDLPGSTWVTHGGTAKQVDVLDGRVVLRQQESEDVSAPLAGGPFPSGTLFASLTVVYSAPPRGDGGFFLHFKDAGSGQRAKLYATTNGVSTGKWRAGVANGSGAPLHISEDLAFGVPYKFVLRYLNQAPGATTLWIDPTSVDSGLRRVDSSDGGGAVQVAAIALRQSLSAGDGMGELSVDDLLVGTSFDDVAGANTAPTISSLPDLDLGAGQSSSILPFVVEDRETPAELLQVSLSSSSPSLVSAKAATILGTGRARSLRISAEGGLQGVASLTLTVSDGQRTAVTSFQVTVGAPSLVGPDRGVQPQDSVSVPWRFEVTDRESKSESLRLQAVCANTNLFSPAGIAWEGVGRERVLRLTPTSGGTGVAVFAVTVSDGEMSRTKEFQVTVHPVLGLLLDENFGTADGPLITAGSRWGMHAPADGDTNATRVSGGVLKLSEKSVEDVHATLQQGPFRAQSGAILYAGVRFRLTQLPSKDGTFIGHFRDERSGFRCRLQVANPARSSTSFQVGLSAGAEDPVLAGRQVSLGEWVLAVMAYHVSTGEARLWLDPGSEADPMLEAADAAAPLTLSNWSFRQATGMGEVEVDTLKVGTGFEDVVQGGGLSPTLEIGLESKGLRLAWGPAAGFRLQTSAMPGTSGWADVTVQPVAEAGRYFLVLPMPESAAFFRLLRE